MKRNRPMNYTPIPWGENREVINFKDYHRNSERLEELLNRNREARWHMVKGILDEGFKNIVDNWWTAIRNEVNSYEGFKQLFKLKYWSESIQNIVRDNLYIGKYDATREQTPTAYFLGKICIARHLEPKISEECLITKISYHFEEGIVRARLCGQVKTIGGKVWRLSWRVMNRRRTTCLLYTSRCV